MEIKKKKKKSGEAIKTTLPNPSPAQPGGLILGE
jgi:hypothetical protein